MHKLHRFGMSALALAVALSLAGCGDKKEEDKAASQVAAKVNGDEVTVHQLNHELSKLGNLTPEQSTQAANQVLRSIVDQQLLVQKAIEDKLDRDPQVLQTLEAARRQILSQSYVQKVTASVPAPTDAEITEYFNKNPALFSERRIYRLQEISIQASPDNIEAIKAELAKAKSLGDFVQWLKDQKIPARAGQSVKAAEQLPLELLPRLAQMKVGQAINVANGNILNIVVVADSQSQPKTLEQAKGDIERFLANSKKREVALADLKQLREKAKIEYLGAYSEAGKESAPAAAAPAAPAAPAAAPAAAAPAADQGALERGAAGLK